MNITFECFGLTLDAEVTFYPGREGRLSGPPEDCYPSEPDEIEFEKLVCIVDDLDGEKKVYDAMFLLYSSDVEDLEEAAVAEARVAYRDWLEDERAEAAACESDDIPF